jgi:hypothetical protein
MLLNLKQNSKTECINESPFDEVYESQSSDDCLLEDLCPDSASESISGDNTVKTEYEIQGQITDWANKYSIPLDALSALFKILKKHHPQFPSDPRTILKTQMSYTLEERCGGCHKCDYVRK